MTSPKYKNKAIRLVQEHGFEKAVSVASKNAINDSEWVYILHAISNLFRKERNIDHSKGWIAPPFSVINTHRGYYKNLTQKWRETGLGESAVGRPNNLIGVQIHVDHTKTVGTSIFNPAIANIVYEWFLDDSATIFDPFCGGPERGIVAASLGHSYTGIDIRHEQISANYKFAKDYSVKLNKEIAWECADATTFDYPNSDFIFTCPPYYNLEKYSDLPNDLSNQESYLNFVKMYEQVIEKCCNSCNGYIVFVVGSLRDSEKFLIDLPGDTVKLFSEYGFGLYNEVVLYAVGSASVRANFKYKRVCNVHQKILVFARR